MRTKLRCRGVMLRAHNPAANVPPRTLSYLLLFPFFSFPLPSEITYNICQRTDTADGAVTIALQRNPLEKCPLYYLSEAIYRTLSSLLLFSFRFFVFLLPSSSWSRLCAPGLARTLIPETADIARDRCDSKSAKFDRAVAPIRRQATRSLSNLVYIPTKRSPRSLDSFIGVTIRYICVNYIADAIATCASRM